MRQPTATTDHSDPPSPRLPSAHTHTLHPADSVDATLLVLARVLGAIAEAKVAEERRRSHVA